MATKSIGSLRDCYIGLSLAFYKKESALRDIISRAQKGYLSSEHTSLLKQKTIDIFKLFSSSNLASQRKILADDEIGVLGAFYEIIEKCAHDRMLMLYVIPTLDGMLFDNRKNIMIFKQLLQDQPKDNNILTKIINIMNLEYDMIVYEAAARILAVFLSELDPKVYWEYQENFMNLLLANPEKAKRMSDHNVMACLASLFRRESLIKHFLKAGGMSIIARVLREAFDIQTVYYTFLTCWLISYEDFSIQYFQDAVNGIIKLMVKSLEALSREKLIRVGYACFRNLSRDDLCLEIMIDSGLLKVTDIILKGVLKDKDTLEDVEYIGNLLEKNLKVLTSFEKYVKEINSHVLDWTPVHSERFWRENVRKFEENDFHYIRKLVMLLDDSNIMVREKNQAIACYDLGEFCRFHPFGKNVLDKLNAKISIMKLIDSENPQVKEQALVAIQKIMLNSWESASITTADDEKAQAK